MRIPFLTAILVAFALLSVWFIFGVPQYKKGSGDTEQPTACTKDARICPDGSTVGREGPSCEFAPCPSVPVEDIIIIDAPSSGDRVTSPITVSGKARGNWFFEGSFPIVVVNWDGLIIGEGIATAEGEWMTTEYVPFTGSVFYTLDPNTPYDRGAVIFRKDNPSGLPGNDDAREVPIFFSKIPPPVEDDGLEEYPDASWDSGDDVYIVPWVENEPIACTMDAKICPDGSAVGRVAPNCEFAPCPGE